MAHEPDFSQLVVVGSSAGGIDALSTLLSSLAPDFPAPIVIAQHLDPERVSHLQEILARRTSMPVITVGNSERLKPGMVYVVPANRDVYITDHDVGVRAGDPTRPKPSVDLLLTTASEVYGDRLIAVILTGTGTDGAAGARAVKRTGGTVVIQDPSTAPFPGMPLALAPNLVDVVATMDRMGTALRDLLDGTPEPTQPSQRQQLGAFLEEVRERSGIDFNSYKTPTILRRLHRRIVATETGDLDTYIRFASAHSEEYQQLVNSFLIKVTEFFRDPDLYAYLRDQVIPDLIEYARTHGNELRVWSAGCATGEEAYTLAILFCEALGSDVDRANIRIFGTDADAEAIAFARRGVYPSSALAGVPEDLLARYFARDENTYQIRKRVRALTVFGQHDLGSRAPFPHIDLVVCRNVLIYFTPELQQRTLQLFAYSLRNHGYLVLGKAESISPLAELFAAQNPLLKIFRREGERVLMPPARFVDEVPHAPRQPRPRARHPSTNLSPTSLKLEVQRVRNVNDNLLMRLPVGVVVADHHYDIQSINGAARRFLAIHGPAIGEDLVHLSQRIPSDRLRAAIDTTFRTGASTTMDTIEVQDIAGTTEHDLQISCHLLRVDSEEGLFDAVMVVISDVTPLAQAQRETQRQLRETASTLQEMRQASDQDAAQRAETIGRLTTANRELVEANQELTTINEELRGTNEELMLSAEEAQAATEEVETLNEELQATNEELETLNEELQSTIEELNTTNDDLAARSSEMQALARSNDEERARLQSILSSMGDAVLVVDPQGAPVLTNRAYDQTIGTLGAEWEPRDAEGTPLPPQATPQRRAARGETFSMEFTVQTPDGAQRWYEANGRPVITGEGGSQGAVVVIRDITDRSLHRLQEEFMARASHELRTPLTPLQAMLQRLDQRLKQQGADASTQRYAQTAYEQAQRLNRLVNDLLDVSALQSGKYSVRPTRIRLDEMVAQAIEMSRLIAEDWTIDYEQPNQAIWVNGDSDRLQQVVLNLVNNAFVHAAKAKRLTVRLRLDTRMAELQVQDYGEGIPEAELQSIFSRFYQAPSSTQHGGRGLGLGLYIAHEIVTAHGGSLTATSTVGKGTTFTVQLPTAPEEEGGKGRGRR